MPYSTHGNPALKIEGAGFQEHFRRKVINARVSRRAAELRPALEARAAIQPEGFAQERTLNVQAWAGVPPREVVGVLRETLKPFVYERQIVRLDA